MNARSRGWELGHFVGSSEKYNFACSLPTEGQVTEILAKVEDAKA